MVHKKAPVPVQVSWSSEEYKRVVKYCALLVQIDKRMARQAAANAQNEKEKPKDPPYGDIDPQLRGSFFAFFGLFLFATTFIFNHSILIKFFTSDSCCYDRHHRINAQQRSVRNTLS